MWNRTTLFALILLLAVATSIAQKEKTTTQAPPTTSASARGQQTTIAAQKPTKAPAINTPASPAQHSNNPQNTTTAAPKVVDPCTEIKKLINAENIKKLSSGTYYVNKTSVNWYEAKSFCELIGSQLATFETKEEMKQVAENSGYSFRWFWVSASDIGHPMGKFFWANGAKVDDTMWTGGEPNDFGFKKDTCASLFTAPPKLRDYSCLDTSFFICEVSPNTAKCV